MQLGPVLSRPFGFQEPPKSKLKGKINTEKTTTATNTARQPSFEWSNFKI